MNVTDAQIPQVIFGDAGAEQAYFDADSYEFDDLEFLDGVAKDDEWSAEFNARREMNFGSYYGFIQSGLQYRTREKSYDATTLVYDGFDGPDLLLSQFQTTVDYPLAVNFGPAVDAGALSQSQPQHRCHLQALVLILKLKRTPTRVRGPLQEMSVSGSAHNA